MEYEPFWLLAVNLILFILTQPRHDASLPRYDNHSGTVWNSPTTCTLGCALTFASEGKFEIEAKISFRLEAKKKPDFKWFTSMRNTKNLKQNEGKISEKMEAKRKLSEKKWKKAKKKQKKRKKSEKKHKKAKKSFKKV